MTRSHAVNDGLIGIRLRTRPALRTHVPLGLVLGIVIAAPSHGQVSLSLLADHALTPNESDSIGVFCRCFHHAPRNQFYCVYAARPAGSTLPPGRMPRFAWREYDASFGFTGRQGSLAGFPSAGDFGMVQVDSTYYHLTVAGTNYKLSRFDDDLVLLGSTIIPLDLHDSNTDQLMGYAHDGLVIGALHEPTETSPRFPMQADWTPSAHLFQYDLALQPLAPDRYLVPTFYSWGGSVVWNPDNARFQIVTMDSFPTYQLYAYEYDANWNWLGQHLLADDGQWSQGLIWDGTYYYVAYHSGHEHRSGNVVVAVFDLDWNRLFSTTITENDPFPPPLGSNTNAQRPFITKVGDTLYVSYDAGTYTYYGGGTIRENFDWQAHVSALRINHVTGVPAATPHGAWTVFPQPSRGVFHLGRENMQDLADIEVVDLAGRIVEARKMRGASDSIDLSLRPAGIYFLRIRAAGATEIWRLVKID